MFPNKDENSALGAENSNVNEGAFPISFMVPGKFHGQATQYVQAGMTLRDYFAASVVVNFSSRMDYKTAAVESYRVADAMLWARKEGGGDGK